ncbi:MAG: hypothetical protein GX806_02135 [Lentisphaerae bacterium]|nr:hypothetical protein [Lentisphaerota bacterium]
MKQGQEQPVEISESDILFECCHCGKSLVIDYRAAGLKIPCPACRESVQVPIPEGVDIADLDQLGIVEAKNGHEDSLGASGAVLPQAEEDIRRLMLELEELRFRRRFLEQQRADTLKWLQALERQFMVMRAALDELDELLQHLRAPAADETQSII